MRILVVRHGHAEPKQSWSGDDSDRPLIARGRTQAQALASTLSTSNPTRIIASPAVRCRQTIEPLAERCRLPVELSSSLAPEAGGAAATFVYELVATEPASSCVVLCTHREVLVRLLPRLADSSGVKLGHRLPGAKGGVWMLNFRKKRLVKVGYRPAG